MDQNKRGRQILKSILAPKWVQSVLILIAAFSGGAAFVLSALVYFGVLPDYAPPPPLDNVKIETPESEKAASAKTLLDAFPLFSGDADPVVPTFDRDKILEDYQHRMNADFNVPQRLKPRVAFWFDVYTRYDDNQRVIHHGLYPWIVYKVIDVSSIINAPLPAHRWMRNEKADLFVYKEEIRVKKAIQSLAKRKDLHDLTADEELVANALRPLARDVRVAAKKALHQVRVQTGQRNHFVDGLLISSRYMGAMERIFASHKLPIELTRIPFVESSFDKAATSRVGATGIWQFMGDTGRKFLIVNHDIDERRSPFKATEAAARLLKENHMILYRSWPLAVTAWNHGPTGLRRAIKSTRSRDLAVIVDNYHSRNFDFASANFYSEFLAALYAERYHEEVFGQLRRESPMDLQIVRLSRTVRFTELLRASGMDRDEFVLLNPDLKKVSNSNSVVPKGFRLQIPSASMPNMRRGFVTFIASEDADPS